VPLTDGVRKYDEARPVSTDRYLAGASRGLSSTAKLPPGLGLDCWGRGFSGLASIRSRSTVVTSLGSPVKSASRGAGRCDSTCPRPSRQTSMVLRSHKS
jgi:hypothetical protein